MTQPYNKPLPQRLPENEPFWEGLENREFRVPKCDDCGHWGWVPYPACRNCLSTNQTWTKTTGKGKVFSYTVVHRGPGGFRDDVPYVLAMVEFPEGPRTPIVIGTMVDVDPDAVYTGMSVKVTYEDIEGEGVTIWHFAPDS
jgi:uncharacterized OB-fold protein